MNRPRPVHHWCGRRVMCDALWDYEAWLEDLWLEYGGAASLAVAYRPEGV